MTKPLLKKVFRLLIFHWSNKPLISWSKTMSMKMSWLLRFLDNLLCIWMLEQLLSTLHGFLTSFSSVVASFLAILKWPNLVGGRWWWWLLADVSTKQNSSKLPGFYKLEYPYSYFCLLLHEFVSLWWRSHTPTQPMAISYTTHVSYTTHERSHTPTQPMCGSDGDPTLPHNPYTKWDICKSEVLSINYILLQLSLLLVAGLID